MYWHSNENKLCTFFVIFLWGKAVTRYALRRFLVEMKMLVYSLNFLIFTSKSKESVCVCKSVQVYILLELEYSLVICKFNKLNIDMPLVARDNWNWTMLKLFKGFIDQRKEEKAALIEMFHQATELWVVAVCSSQIPYEKKNYSCHFWVLQEWTMKDEECIMCRSCVECRCSNSHFFVCYFIHHENIYACLQDCAPVKLL